MEPSTSFVPNYLTRNAMLFHQYHGENVELLDSRERALRRTSFEKAYVFSERQLFEHELFSVAIEEVEGGWAGHLRIGLTSIDPDSRPSTLEVERRSWLISVSPSSVPLTTTSSLPTEKGARIGVFFERDSGRTRIHVLLNGFDMCIEPNDIPAIGPLFAVVDVFGNTKEVRIVHPIVRAPESLYRLCTSQVGQLINDGRCSATDVPAPLRPRFVS